MCAHMSPLTCLPDIAELHVVGAISPGSDAATAEARLVPDAVDLLAGGATLGNIGDVV